MERLTSIRPVFCDLIPEEVEHGVLYISEKYEIAIHLCACGCGMKAVTPIRSSEWTLTKNENSVSLSPSIGNFTWERPNYHAHYFITNNQVRWC